jgi:hypothetical protein
MASMELTPAQSTEEGAEMQQYQPRYAVGELYLGDEAIKALGLAELPQVGSMIAFSGMAKVVSISQRDDNRVNPDGDAETCMSLQPVDLVVRPPARDARPQFPKSKMEP